jgi:alpha-tubulin suppressor-like RCC1 family protein
MMGSNEHGKLGVGSDSEIIGEPTLIETLRPQVIKEVSLGYSHALAITSLDELYGWGDGLSLGIGTKETQ